MNYFVHMRKQYITTHQQTQPCQQPNNIISDNNSHSVTQSQKDNPVKGECLCNNAFKLVCHKMYFEDNY